MRESAWATTLHTQLAYARNVGQLTMSSLLSEISPGGDGRAHGVPVAERRCGAAACEGESMSEAGGGYPDFCTQSLEPDQSGKVGSWAGEQRIDPDSNRTIRGGQ